MAPAKKKPVSSRSSRRTATAAPNALTVRLFHWNADEAAQRAASLEKAGYSVDARQGDPSNYKQLRSNPPDVVVIDLSRLPSHGREVAMYLRQSPKSRGVPIVFVDGAAEKLERVRKVVPDAVYTTWSKIRSGVRQALAHPPSEPVVPQSTMAGYSGTPLPKKLGIKADMTIAVVNGPDDFEKTLGALPDGVTLRSGLRGKADLILWFTTQRSDLVKRMDAVAAKTPPSGMWICWPKKAAGAATDVTQNDVRRQGLDAGLVDYKIAAIDETWSGLKFAVRKK